MAGIDNASKFRSKEDEERLRRQKAKAPTDINRARELAKQYSNPHKFSNTVTTKQTVREDRWYSGDKPTARETYARMFQVAGDDQNKMKELQGQYAQEISNPGSVIYNPYAQATNTKAINGLRELGIDVPNVITDQWVDKMWGQYGQYGRQTTTSYGPSAPTTKSTRENDIAYWVSTLMEDKENTNLAEAQMKSLYDEVAYLTKQGYSDNEIVKRVRNEFGSKYNVLNKMDEERMVGSAVRLNRAVDYSGDDTLYGMIWAARNDGGTGDYFTDAVNYAMGNGKKYKADPTSEAALDPTSPDYNPYGRGGTMHDLQMKYGVTSFSRDWLDKNRATILSDPDGYKDIEKIQGGIEDYENATAELAELDKWVEKQIARGVTMEKIEAGLDALIKAGGDEAELIKVPTLKKMEDKRYAGTYLGLADAVDFTMPGYLDKVADKIAERDAGAAVQEEENEQREATKLGKWLSEAGAGVSRFFASMDIGIGSHGDAIDSVLEAEHGSMSTDDMVKKYASSQLGVELTGDLQDGEREIVESILEQIDAATKFGASKEEREAAVAGIAVLDQLVGQIAADPERRDSYKANESYTSVYDKQPEEPREGMAPMTAEPMAYTGADGQPVDPYSMPEAGAYEKMLQGGEWDTNALGWGYSMSNNPTAIEAELVEGILGIFNGQKPTGLSKSWYNKFSGLMNNTNKAVRPTGLSQGERDIHAANPELYDSRHMYGSQVYDALMANQKALDDGALHPVDYVKNLVVISAAAEAIGEAAGGARATDEQAAEVLAANNGELQAMLDSANGIVAQGQEAKAAAEAEVRQKIIGVVDAYAAGEQLDMKSETVMNSILSMDVSKAAADDSTYQDISAQVKNSLSMDNLLRSGMTFTTGDFETDMLMDHADLQQSGALVYGQGVMMVVEDMLDEDMRLASACGMTLGEYYEAHPERARSSEQMLAEAQSRYDTTWNEFGKTISGLTAANQKLEGVEKEAKVSVAESLSLKDTIGIIADKFGIQLEADLRKTGHFLNYAWRDQGQKKNALMQQYNNDRTAYAADLNELEKGELTRLQGVYESDASKGDMQFDEWVKQHPEGQHLRELQTMREANVDIFDIGMTVDEIKSGWDIADVTGTMANIDALVEEHGSDADKFIIQSGVSLLNTGLMMATTALGGGGITGSLAATAANAGASAHDRFQQTGNFDAALWSSVAEWGVNAIIEKIGFDRYMPEGIGGGNLATKMMHSKYIMATQNLAQIVRSPESMSKVARGIFAAGIQGLMDAGGEFLEEFFQGIVSAMADNFAYSKPYLLTAKQLGEAAKEGLMAMATAPILSLASGNKISFSDAAGNLIDSAQALLLPEHDGAILNDAIDFQSTRLAIQNSQDQLNQIEQSSENAAKKQAGADLQAANAELAEAQAELADVQSQQEAAAVALEDVNVEMQDSDAFTEDLRERMVTAAENLNKVREHLAKVQERVRAASEKQAEAQQMYEDAKAKVQAMYDAVMEEAKARARQVVTDLFFGGDSEAQQAASQKYLDACARLMDAKNRLRSAKADAEMYGRGSTQSDAARTAYGEALLEVEALTEEVAAAKAEVDAAYAETAEGKVEAAQNEELTTAALAAEQARAEADADPMNAKKQAKAELEESKLRTIRAKQDLEEKRSGISQRLKDPRSDVREAAVNEWNALQEEANAAAAESEALQTEYDKTDTQKQLANAIEEAQGYTNEQVLFPDEPGHVQAVRAHNNLALAKADVEVENAYSALSETEVGTSEYDAALDAYNKAVEAREDEVGRQMGTTGDAVREMLRKSPLGEQVMDAVKQGNQTRAANLIEQIMNSNPERRAELAKQAVKQRSPFKLLADVETGAKGKAGVTKVYSKAAGKRLNSDAKMQLRILNELAKESGFEIVVKDTLSNVKGAINGMLAKGGTIYIGLDAIEQGYLQAGTHEIVHGIRGRDEAAYNELKQVVTEILSEQGLSIDQMVQDRIDSYATAGQQLTEDGALEEIIAESAAQIWGSEANLKKFADEHPNAFKRVYNAFMEFWKKVQDISARIAQRNDRKEITAMLSDDGAMQKVYDTFMKVAKEAGLETTAEVEAKYSLQETTDGRMVAVVDADILEGVYDGEWTPAVHKAAKKAVQRELWKFADGIVVDNIRYDVNRTTRREIARSGYGEKLKRNDGEVFADRLRSANVLDDVIRATVGWTADGELDHERNDNIVDFVRGDTLIAAGDHKYKAITVVGITDGGQYVAYDIVNVEPDTFAIKEAPSTTAYANNMLSDTHEGATETRITEKDANVNLSLNESAQNREIANDLAGQLVNNTDNAMEIADILSRISGDMWRDHRTPARTGEQTTADRNPIEILSDLTRSIRVGYNPGGTVSVDGERVPRAVLGVYERLASSITTRTSDAGDLELGLHEFGHAVHDRLTGLQANDRLMNSLSQDVRDAYDEPLWEGEAIAEFVIDYIFSRDAAINLAGDDFVREFENLLRQDRDLYNAIMDASHQVELWNNADPESRMGAMVKSYGVDPRRREIGNWLSRQLRGLDTGLFDYTAPAKLVSRDFHRQALYSAHARKRSDVVLNQRLIDPSGREIGQSLAERLYDAGVGEADMNAIVSFALARHALDRRNQNKDVFTPREFSNAQLREIVNRYAGTNIEAGANALTSFWNDFMDAWMVDTGLIDRETIENMRAMYPHYVPTFRVVGENFNEFGGRRSTFQLREAVEGGSSLEVINPMISMVDQVQKVVNTVTNNQVMRAFHREMQRGGMGDIARLIPQREVASHTDISRAMAAFNTVVQGSNADPDAVENMVRELAALEQQFIATGQGAGTNVVSGVDEYGNRFFYEIYDKPLFNLLNGSVHAATGVPELVRRFKNTFTALTTGSNPLFALKNAQRDFQASVNTGTWALTYADGMAKWIWALGEVFANSESYQQWKSMGGGSHSRFRSAMIDPADANKLARQVSQALLRGRRTITGNFKVNSAALDKISQVITLEKLNSAVEDASRFAEWRFGRHDMDTEEGRLEAFMRSQDVTTNFGTHGAYGWIQSLNKFVPFMNATLQGTAKDIHIVADIFGPDAAARAEALPKAAKIVMNSALTAAFQMAILKSFTDGEEDDEDYALLNDAMKAGNLIIPLPKSVRSSLEEFSGFSKPYIRVPIAQGVLHQGMHAVFLDTFANVKDYSPMEVDLMTTVFQIMAEGIPTDGTIFQAFMDAKNNKTWYGKAIESSYMQSGSEYNRYKEGTSQAVINLARFIGTSPAKLDYLLNQYSGVVGKVVAPLASGEGLKGLLNNVLSAYTVDPVETNDLSDDFSAARTLLDQTVTDGKRGNPLGNLAYGIDANAAFDEAVYLDKYFEAAYKEANALWAERTEIANSTGMSRGERTRTMRKIRQEINAIYADALAEFDSFKMQYVNRDWMAMDAMKDLLGVATKSTLD